MVMKITEKTSTESSEQEKHGKERSLEVSSLGSWRADFTGLPNLFPEDPEKDGIDRLIECLDLSKVPMNPSRTSGIISSDSLRGLDDLEKFDIDIDKKRKLDRSLTKFSTILEERHGYTIDVDMALDSLWNLKRADFIDNKTTEITARYSEESKPVVFVGNIGVMQAPRIES